MYVLGQMITNATKSGDVIAMLVDIFGSNELFVEQYKCMLAQRLLALRQYDADDDVLTLSMLLVLLLTNSYSYFYFYSYSI